VTFESVTVSRCQSDNVLDIDVTNAADISAFEIIFEVASTSGNGFYTDIDVEWAAGLTVLTHRIVDLGGVDYTSPDTIRIAGMLIDPGDACLGGGTTTVGQVKFTSNNVCDGTFDLAGADFTCQTACGCPISATTQFVDCATTTLVPATVNPGTVTIQNQAPTIDPIANATIHWGDPFSYTITGDDPDLHTVPGGCEKLSYGLVSGPAGMTVNASGGAIYWPTDGDDVCTHLVEVEIIDTCGASASTTFTICVYNDPPIITCPTDTTFIVWSQTASGSVSATDPDGGPGPLLYSVASFSGPGTVNINPANGDWDWPTIEDNAYLGYHELCIAVSDGADTCAGCSPSNADTCCVTIYVIPTIRAWIEKVHDVYQGHYEEVSIYLDDMINPPNEMGGFDFLIQYDASALTFQYAEPGQMLVDCGWEYFTYRYGPSGNCGPNACPSGMLRVVAIAETNNGPNHPSCYVGTPGHLVTLTFLVTNDRTYECMYVPIRWFWYDCGDNTFSSVTGDTLFISRHVYDYDNAVPVENPYVGYPTPFGAQADCDVDTGDGKPDPLRIVDFWNGGIDIICADSIDARGDINLNAIANEIADAVLFSNYFVKGLGVFTINVEGQTAASDVNADGIPLTVGDLVYQIRIIVGDALPYPKLGGAVDANLINDAGRLSIGDAVPMGAAFVIADGAVTPRLLAENMEMKYAYDAENDATRILVYSFTAESFTGEFLAVPSEVLTIEMATYQGASVNLLQVPTEYRLAQNFPNPFNPTTTISFETPVSTQYSLVIYNINGQEVRRLEGAVTAGAHQIEFDASALASGVYFYNLHAGNFSDTKKMVLLK
jgi:hypothetical protein